ncbi:serine O-acetyltransferase [Bacillus sp. X1(2014)]|uniref:serine O-acetyltransferase n=1 Tax=Bacillus sp. X1(2014) TaxID=1565991 RepID=UPI0011AA195C|nr:serine acetyltransferase [Bacillus sp. X1(2014)]
MIKTLKDLHEYLQYEKMLYPNSFVDILTNDQRTYNWRYIKYLRICEYFYNNRHRSIFDKILYLLYRRKKNVLGSRIGVEIWENSFAKGLVIHHNGSIVVNRECRIGENCELHGDNCLGNAGVGPLCPTLGNNVKIGVGAKIIGKVTIANGIKIGANAVVNKSFLEPNITIVGIPARKVEKGMEK